MLFHSPVDKKSAKHDGNVPGKCNKQQQNPPYLKKVEPTDPVEVSLETEQGGAVVNPCRDDAKTKPCRVPDCRRSDRRVGGGGRHAVEGSGGGGGGMVGGWGRRAGVTSKRQRTYHDHVRAVKLSPISLSAVAGVTAFYLVAGDTGFASSCGLSEQSQSGLRR
ncbi:hypothetical protein BaRGS_00038602 [Batillaria attramentaria]|uniref:Uncharacterized protein n=1 Tax=Batillaria attramentaria TaxID=370345 RepID=A0ABD0J5M6_9CAEN